MFDFLFVLLTTLFFLYKMSMIKYGILIFYSFGLIGNLLTNSIAQEKAIIEYVINQKRLNINISKKTIYLNYILNIIQKTLVWPGYALLTMYDILFPIKKEEV